MSVCQDFSRLNAMVFAPMISLESARLGPVRSFTAHCQMRLRPYWLPSHEKAGRRPCQRAATQHCQPRRAATYQDWRDGGWMRAATKRSMPNIPRQRKVVGAVRGKGMVGVAGFEPATPTSRTWCATRLRYTPTEARSYIDGPAWPQACKRRRVPAAVTGPKGP
jgi:hypothetical protein